MSYDNARKAYSKEHLWFMVITIDGTDYRFCENRRALPSGLNAQPTMKRVSVSPTEINIDGGIGLRAKCSIALEESNDYTIWGTPSAPVRFWARWRAENPYYLGAELKLYSGYIVNGEFNIANFQERLYVIESFSQAASGVSITGKDPLKLIDNDRSQAPVESKGLLSADIDNLVTSITLTPSGIGSEYPSSNFKVRVGDEIMTCTSRAGDVLTVTRGQLNTLADEHNEDDLVQLCLEYSSDTVSDILYDLIVNYSPISSSYINKVAWDAESSNAFTPTYSTVITEPTGVKELINEFAQSAPFYLFWDERISQIRFKALTPPPDEAQFYSWESNFLEGTTAFKDRQDLRVSTVVVNFGIFDPTKDLDETSNYRQTYVREDTDSVTNYGQRKIKTIQSRWISNDNKAAAVLVAARIGRRLSEAPRELEFSVDPKDGDIWTGDDIRAETDLILNDTGAFANLPYQVLSAQETSTFNYSCLEHTYGDAVPGDNDAEDPNVRLVYIAGEQVRLQDDLGNPRTLREVYQDVFGTGTIGADLDIRFIFESNCVAGSDDNAEYSVLTGSWPELTTPPLLDVRGLIVGKGGDADSSGVNINNNGGPALQLQDDIRLNNTGIIGGGGGAGGSANDSFAEAYGGGGAGFTNGLAGTGTSTGETIISLTQPNNGTNTAGGSGGSVFYQRAGEVFSVSGGAGGGLGQSGNNGTGGTTTAGGTAGKAIDLNGFVITYINTGDIRGTVS